MGMFDEFVFVDGELTPYCAYGHALRTLQTKDIDCSMLRYIVYSDTVYEKKELRYSGSDEIEKVYALSDDGEASLVESTRVVFTKNRLTGMFRIYGSCSQCRPLLFFTGDKAWNGDMVNETHYLLMFNLTVRKGQVKALEPVDVPMREQAIERYKKDGYLLFDDNDSIAMAHWRMKELREKKEKRQ